MKERMPAHLLPLHGISHRRSLANKTLPQPLLDPLVQHAVQEKVSTGSKLVEQEPDAAWQRRFGPAGSMLPGLDGHDAASGHRLWGCATSNGMFKQSTGWLAKGESRQLASRQNDPCKSPAHRRWNQVEPSVRSLKAVTHVIPAPAVEPDRNTLIVLYLGYGGKTINTLRLGPRLAPDYFDFQQFAPEICGALEDSQAKSLTRVLYLTIPRCGPRTAISQEYFLSRVRGRSDTSFQRYNTEWIGCLKGRHPTQ